MTHNKKRQNRNSAEITRNPSPLSTIRIIMDPEIGIYSSKYRKCWKTTVFNMETYANFPQKTEFSWVESFFNIWL